MNPKATHKASQKKEKLDLKAQSVFEVKTSIKAGKSGYNFYEDQGLGWAKPDTLTCENNPGVF